MTIHGASYKFFPTGGYNYIYNNTFIKGVKYMGEEIQSFKATGCLADGWKSNSKFEFNKVIGTSDSWRNSMSDHSEEQIRKVLTGFNQCGTAYPRSACDAGMYCK
ncbi:uncharacterized protein LOC113281115 [Papaver somniferum]|uniref:uncharacterized protein LOC113281115 n=1 Tax=Papaver somniferum TaxID=3469 RepID=UPI000E6FBED4|nr:uncharacterized protein LOC113281115 [Papaver somniferum]XP_026385549.1 uncharacterized protein LOC113281115 [Papaver somniferum]